MFAHIDNISVGSWFLIALGISTVLGGIAYCGSWGMKQKIDGFLMSCFGMFGTIVAGGVLYLSGCYIGGHTIRYGFNGRVIRFLKDEWLVAVLLVLVVIPAVLAMMNLIAHHNSGNSVKQTVPRSVYHIAAFCAVILVSIALMGVFSRVWFA